MESNIFGVLSISGEKLYLTNLINSLVVLMQDMNHLNHYSIIFVNKPRIEYKVVYCSRSEQWELFIAIVTMPGFIRKRNVLGVNVTLMVAFLSHRDYAEEL